MLAVILDVECPVKRHDLRQRAAVVVVGAGGRQSALVGRRGLGFARSLVLHAVDVEEQRIALPFRGRRNDAVCPERRREALHLHHPAGALLEAG